MNKPQSIQTYADYTEAFLKLAKEENLSLDKERLTQVIRKYKLDDIERAYDACLRFGIGNIFNYL